MLCLMYVFIVYKKNLPTCLALHVIYFIVIKIVGEGRILGHAAKTLHEVVDLVSSEASCVCFVQGPESCITFPMRSYLSSS